MAQAFKYRTLSVDTQSPDGTVVFDSLVGDPKNVGRSGTPLGMYLNSADVGPDGWEVCGVVQLLTQATVILKRQS